MDEVYASLAYDGAPLLRIPLVLAELYLLSLKWYQ